jgi:hypothetical protein
LTFDLNTTRPWRGPVGQVRLAGRPVPINRVAGFRVLANRDRAVGPP